MQIAHIKKFALQKIFSSLNFNQTPLRNGFFQATTAQARIYTEFPPLDPYPRTKT